MASISSSLSLSSTASYARPTATLTARAVQPTQPTNFPGMYTKQLSFNFEEKPQVFAKTLKGVSGGVCQRAGCESSGATYLNKDNRRYYCRYCARDINKHSVRSTWALYGVKNLCEPLTVD